jgi:chorismate synthase
VETSSNNSGGILGGISSGMPIISRLTFKPTPSIRKAQKTVNLKTMEETEITIEGRHDPCIVPRAVPVVESVTALVLVDHLMRYGILPQVMEGKS